MDQELTSETRLRQFFIRRYQERIERKLDTWPGLSNPLEYLLNDREFYQGRVYAYSNSLGNWKLTIGLILWEVMGMDTNDYMVLCDMIANPKDPLEEYSTALALSSDLSLEDNWFRIGMYPSKIAFQNISRYLNEYHTYLEENNEDDFWSMKPSKLNGFYPLEYGLMIYVKEEWAKITWPHPNQALTAKLPFTYTQASDHQSDHIPLQKQAGRKEMRVLFSAVGTDKAQDMYECLPETWKIVFPSDFALTDENKGKILNSEGGKISLDWTKIFEDHPPKSEAWTGNEVNFWWHIIVARVVFAFSGQLPYPPSRPETDRKLESLGDLYRLFRLGSPRYLKLDIQGHGCNDIAPSVD
ncbi:hypothetical protein Forpe1208_v016279 [Fusarium oxysporum f. sp. rapae]|uniref:Uncharacterized protein n=1 Tax=Fusarium oxysporum f. sp. rapae TaxID=485398 RepID=A0A8J5TME3_FUSOX|nr:hypothetical protein Forpe1208_v016279 [Fusarium oxysporum f. sp. rapae]